MDEDRKEHDIKTTLLNLDELYYEIIKLFDTVSEMIQKVIANRFKPNVSPETSEHIKEVLQKFSRINFEKKKINLSVSAAIEMLELQEPCIITNDNTVRSNEHAFIAEKIMLSADNGNKYENSNVASVLPDCVNDVFSTKDLQREREQYIHHFDSIRTITSSKGLVKKIPMENFQTFSETLSDLKIGNFSKVDRIKIIKSISKITKSIHEPERKAYANTDLTMQFENITRSSCFRKPFSVDIRLSNDETEVLSASKAIFQNLTRDYVISGNGRSTGSNSLKEAAGEDQHFNMHGDIVVMPYDRKENQEQLNELVKYLSLSYSNSYDVQIQQSLGLQARETNELFVMDVDITINQLSRKPVKRRFSFRMHVVNSEIFETAMRDCQVFSLELTYTNIFPSDCRMFIALPIYRDGYLDRKDRLDRN